MHVITKFANGSQSSCKQLKHLTAYITNPKKTSRNLIYANGLFVDSAFDNMMLIKQLAGKTDGRQYIHWITSFNPEDNICPELAHKLGRQFAEGFNDFQWIMATHIDRSHIHNHYIMNSVSSITGEKFTQSPGDLKKLKEYIEKTYRQSLLFDSEIPEFYKEEITMYDTKNDWDIFDEDDNIYSSTKELSDLRHDIQELTKGVTAMAQCMQGYMQMCNPQTLSNAISYEVDRQLSQRFGTLPNPNQKYIKG